MKLPKVSGGLNYRSGMNMSRDEKDGITPSECASVTVINGKVCLNLPLGFGRYCLDVPRSIPDGTILRGCGDICWKSGLFGVQFPAGACGIVTAPGIGEVARGCVGDC